MGVATFDVEVRKRLYRWLWLPWGELYIRKDKQQEQVHHNSPTRDLGGMTGVAEMATGSSQDLHICQWKRQKDFLTSRMWERKKSWQIPRFLFYQRYMVNWEGEDCKSRELKGQGCKSRVPLRDFPGSPVAKIPCPWFRGPNSIPGQGTTSHLLQLRVHMPQLKILHAAMKTENPVCLS